MDDLANFDDPAEEGVCSIIRLGSFEILKKYVCSCFKLIGACLRFKLLNRSLPTQQAVGLYGEI